MGDLNEYLEDKGMEHVRGAPMHLLPGRRCLHRRKGADPRQNERWLQALKNRILLENFFESELEAAIAAFIDHYNNHRYHEVASAT